MNKYEESRAAAIKIQATTRYFVSKQSFNVAKTREKNVLMNELLRDQAKKLSIHEKESKKAKQSLYGLNNELSVLFNKM